MANVEISGCSQFGNRKAAVKFSKSLLYSSIKNSTLHTGLGQAVQVEASSNILMENNVIFDFGKYGVNISGSHNVTMDGNQIAVISDMQHGEAASSEA